MADEIKIVIKLINLITINHTFVPEIGLNFHYGTNMIRKYRQTKHLRLQADIRGNDYKKPLRLPKSQSLKRSLQGA